jgi:cell division protein FtsB
MSTIDKLKQAQMQREAPQSNRHCEAHSDPSLRGTVGAEAISTSNSTKRTSRTNTNWLISSILFIIIVINLGFTFKLFSMLKENNSKGNNSLEKLAMVGKVVTDHANKIDSISSSLNQLEKQANSQSVTNQKLIKSNNALFEKVNLLESKLDQILKQNQ